MHRHPWPVTPSPPTGGRGLRGPVAVLKPRGPSVPTRAAAGAIPPMAGHRPSHHFFPLPGSGGGGPRGPVPLRVDTLTWLSTQAAPGRVMVWPAVRPGVCPDPEVWRISPAPLPHEFRGWIAPCRPRLGAGEAGDWSRSTSEGALPGPYIALRSIPKLPLPEDVSGLLKELQQLAKELRRKRLSLGYSQADVGIAVGVLFGKVLSQTTVCRFEAQQLSLANMWKLRPLLKKWLEEVEAENLLGLCKMEMILQQSRKWRRASRERRIGNSLEKFFQRCPKPTPQQISHIAGCLQLQKDVVRVWFYNRSKMGSRSTNDASPREVVGTAGPPCPGAPVCFHLGLGVPMDIPHYTPLYSAEVAHSSAAATAVGLLRL
nr:POU domain, class 5, transcription factor 2 [Chlorocebus sabaeus]